MSLTLFIVLISATEGVLGRLAGWLAVLFPNGASARVGARHGGQTQAVGRRGGAHCADRCLALVRYGETALFRTCSEDTQKTCCSEGC